MSLDNEIFIGDNLQIMSSNSFVKYHNNIDFIYIDPPYNTKNTFAYNDINNQWEEDIEKRLELAKNLLKDTGVIFISIDDNELITLSEVCYRIFGKRNFVGTFITKQSQRSNTKLINTIHEYIICFAKDKTKVSQFYINRLEDPNEGPLINSIIKKVKHLYRKSEKSAKDELKKAISTYMLQTGETWIKNYNNIDDDGNIYFAKDLSTPGNPKKLDIDEINLHLQPLKTRGWSSREKFIKLYNTKRLVFRNDRPYEIEYLYEAKNNISSILDFYSRYGTNDLKKLGLNDIFDTPKPVELIKFLIRMSMHQNSTILDFYAGSGTTAQAVYEINKEDNLHHNYILIQLDEHVNTKSKAYEKLTSLGMQTPTIADAMLLRINKFLELNNLPCDFTINYLKGKNILIA